MTLLASDYKPKGTGMPRQTLEEVATAYHDAVSEMWALREKFYTAVIRERDKGRTYHDIAEEAGVSFARIYQIVHAPR